MSVSFINKYLIKWNKRYTNWADLHWAWERKYSFWHRPLILTAGYPKALIPFRVPNNITCMCVSPLSFHMEILLYQHGKPAIDTSRILFLLASTLGASCGLAMNHLIHVSVLSPPPPPPPPPPRCFCSLFIISMCVYAYVHISLFLPECACTTIIDTSLWIFSLMYCCCVSIIFVNCIYPPVALIWLINLFLFLFLYWRIQKTNPQTLPQTYARLRPMMQLYELWFISNKYIKWPEMSMWCTFRRFN